MLPRGSNVQPSMHARGCRLEDRLLAVKNRCVPTKLIHQTETIVSTEDLLGATNLHFFIESTLNASESSIRA